MKVVGYVRVSTQEQSDSGLGLASQVGAIESFCQRSGWELVEIARDEGWSGKDMQRPGLRAALDMIASGQVGGLVTALVMRSKRPEAYAALLPPVSSQEHEPAKSENCATAENKS